ncbi:MAG: hypothetical protein F6K30_11450 [Cyanothece sp. SIO2G6]|nr:hypothetical protein [Cyanothece sp. SIO2G6]
MDFLGTANDDQAILDIVTDGATIDGSTDNNGDTATSAADIATGDTLDLSALTEAVAVDLDSSNQGALNPVPETQVGTLTQGVATATLLDIENVIGTNQNDVLFGNNEANVILGGAGDDNIHPFGGVDFVDGGEGVDTLNLSAATGITVDLAAGVAGPNTFVNFENVLGSVNGDDVLLGDAIANDLNGRGQNDVLDGRGGADTLTGGDGADTFAFSGDPFDGADVSAEGRQIVGNEDFITDFEFANDTYRLNATDFGVADDVSFVALDANAADAAIPIGANVIVLLNSDNDGDVTTPFLAGTAATQIAELVDQDGAGFFVYFNSNLQLNRLVYSTNLNDATADLKIISRQTDLIGDSAIAALASFTAENFEFEAVQPDDDAIAPAAVVDGTVIDGNADNNGDTAISAADLATGDTLDLSALTEGVAVDLDSSNQGALNPAPETQVGTLTQGDATVTLLDLENLIGTGQDDTLFGNNEANVILGGAGDDRIHPFGGVDFVDGGDGIDILLLNAATGAVTIDLAQGTAGPNTFVNIENASGSVNFGDRIFGDEGDNLLQGNGGRDLIRGRDGDDTLEGGDDGDFLNGDRGNDIVRGDAGNDVVRGSGGNDRLFGGDNRDRLVGNAGNDRLVGETGNDRLLGGTGDDRLLGNAGNDRLFGNGGNDQLQGGLGNDRLSGGGGSDIFILAQGEGTDQIRDFNIRQDVIGLANGLSFADLTLEGREILAGDEVLATLRRGSAEVLTVDQFVQV